MTDLPTLKLKALVNFPATAIGGAGIEIEKTNGQFVVDLAYSDFAPPVGGISDVTHQNALLWNSVTGVYTLAPISLVGAGGGVPEAPNDGQQYARQSLTWTPVSGGGTPSSANPFMDGVAAPGVATTYSRGDHVHPSDTSRAPLASPVFTGDPRAPTPTAGDNDTSIATTAFVMTAVAAGGTPSNVTPSMDGVAAPGVATAYSRGDHVHPSDTSRQAQDGDLDAIAALSGTGLARRTGASTWSVGAPVVNGDLATMPAFTFKGNDTGSAAGPTDINIASLPIKVSPAGGDILLLSDQSASGTWKQIAISTLPGASGGISEAPNDGQMYGRQSLGWAVVTGGGGVSPSNVLPIMDGTVSAGISALYSRGDHIHPTDTSRAPIVSPGLTGTPTAPTATAGTSTTQLATTAFVGTAVNGVVVPPAAATPLMDGAAAVGIATKYAREDHVHPTDTSRAPLASPTFTGDPKAPTPTVGDNDTSIATTAFVTAAVGAVGAPPSPATAVPLIESGSGAVGASVKYAREDHVHPAFGGAVFAPQGRLTLTSGVAVMVTSVAAATNIYFTPTGGNFCPIYDGTNFSMMPFAELLQTTTDTTKNPAAIGASKVNDWFIWNDSGTMRLSHGPDWTSDTARSAALALVNGFYLNAVAITNGPGAQRGTYVGTTRSNAGSTLDYILGAVSTNGTAAALNVWNAYNRVDVATFVGMSNPSWSYNTTANVWRQQNLQPTYAVSFVRGLNEDGISAVLAGQAQVTALGNNAAVGIGLDSVTTASGRPTYIQSPTTAAWAASAYAYYDGAPGLGYHTLFPLELVSTTSGVNTFYGGPVNYQQSGLGVRMAA